MSGNPRHAHDAGSGAGDVRASSPVPRHRPVSPALPPCRRRAGRRVGTCVRDRDWGRLPTLARPRPLPSPPPLLSLSPTPPTPSPFHTLTVHPHPPPPRTGCASFRARASAWRRAGSAGRARERSGRACAGRRELGSPDPPTVTVRSRCDGHGAATARCREPRECPAGIPSTRSLTSHLTHHLASRSIQKPIV